MPHYSQQCLAFQALIPPPSLAPTQVLNHSSGKEQRVATTMVDCRLWCVWEGGSGACVCGGDVGLGVPAGTASEGKDGMPITEIIY
jgi:hypothetical protein